MFPQLNIIIRAHGYGELELEDIVLEDIDLRILRVGDGPMLVVLAIGESSESSGLNAEVVWQDEINGSADA